MRLKLFLSKLSTGSLEPFLLKSFNKRRGPRAILIFQCQLGSRILLGTKIFRIQRGREPCKMLTCNPIPRGGHGGRGGCNRGARNIRNFGTRMYALEWGCNGTRNIRNRVVMATRMYALATLAEGMYAPYPHKQGGQPESSDHGFPPHSRGRPKIPSGLQETGPSGPAPSSKNPGRDSIWLFTRI